MYTSNSQFYQQADGVAKGGQASSKRAENYMQAHEHTAISSALHSPNIWNQTSPNIWDLLMTLVQFLDISIWKNLSITITIFMKILSLLWRGKVMEN